MRIVLALACTMMALPHRAAAQSDAWPQTQLSPWESIYKWSLANDKYLTFGTKRKFVASYLEEVERNVPPNFSKELLSEIKRQATSHQSLAMERRDDSTFFLLGFRDDLFRHSEATPTEARYILESFSVEKVAFSLAKMPVLRVRVTPVPPRDYQLFINGEEAIVTEHIEYVVPSGMVSIRVQRQSKACSHSVSVRYGETKELSCLLP